jgi:hypothetical protein
MKQQRQFLNELLPLRTMKSKDKTLVDFHLFDFHDPYEPL